MIKNFIDRRKHSENLLMILSGYKDILWDKVFDRVLNFCPQGFDVCILVSGKDVQRLQDIALKNEWSYMSTDINNLCEAQNLCITTFSDAKFIFKMDEDIFLTKCSLSRLKYDYDALCMSEYKPSCIVPMMNVNCVTYIDVLKRRNLLQSFERLFGDAKITNGLHHTKHILENPDVAKFMWSMINIDDDCQLYDALEVKPCPTRFSIGLIMFTREMYNMWGGFEVLLDSQKEYERIGLGVDEKMICQYAMLKSMPIMIDNKVLVGHFAYGPQTQDMITFFKEHPSLF